MKDLYYEVNELSTMNGKTQKISKEDVATLTRGNSAYMEPERTAYSFRHELQYL